MKIIILAAGKGERLMPFTKNTPKSLMDLGNGQTLLEKQLEDIQKSGLIEEVILVVGYLAGQIESKILAHKQNGMRIKTIYNPFYESSNNLVSLWLARNEMDTDFLVSNGDNMFTADVYQDLIKRNSDGIYITINKKDHYDDDDMKVRLKGTKVIEVSKDIVNDNAHAESVGLSFVNGKRFIDIFMETLEQLIRQKEYLNKFWLEVFNSLHKKGVDILSFEIDGKKKWRELDYHLDLGKLRKLIKI